jgi:ketosteroid isomerase-like protein
MQTEETRDLVQAVFAAFATRDPAQIRALFHDDAVWEAPPANGTAEALGAPGGFVAADDIARFISGDMHRLFGDIRVEQMRFYADGEIGIADYRLCATLPNGAAYENPYVFIFECEGGKVRRMREFMDTLNGRRQIFARGHPLEPAAA